MLQSSVVASAFASLGGIESSSNDNADKTVGPMVRFRIVISDEPGRVQEVWMPRANYEMILAAQGGRTLGFDSVDNQSSLLSRFASSSEVEKILNIVMSGLDTKLVSKILSHQLKNIRPPVQGTCDWILNEELYKNWESGSNDSILFVKGQEGVGKSVLARFIIERLNYTYKSASVIHFFTRNVGVNQSNPTTILRYVILQLEEKQPGLLVKSLFRKRIGSFVKQKEFDVLWGLFVAMKEEIDADVYCVIDGLDEVMKDCRFETVEPDPDNSDPMTDFLMQLCELLSNTPSGADNADATRELGSFKTAALFTTRPLLQVQKATNGRDIVVNIEKNDVQKRAQKMIEVDIKDLELPTHLEEAVRTDLMAKLAQTDSPFQWAHAVMERLRTDDLQAGEPISDRLEVFRPGLYSVYYTALESISRDEDTRDLAAKLISTLVFAQDTLEVDGLEHAFSIDINNQEQNVGLTSRATFQAVIRECRSFVIVIDDKYIRLAHQSVRDFFIQLSDEDWPDFSCKNEKKGHKWVAWLSCDTCWFGYAKMSPSKTSNKQPASESVFLLVRAPF